MQYVKVSEEEFKNCFLNNPDITNVSTSIYFSKIRVFGKQVIEIYKHKKYNYEIGYRLYDMEAEEHPIYMAKEFLFMQLLTKGC